MWSTTTSAPTIDATAISARAGVHTRAYTIASATSASIAKLVPTAITERDDVTVVAVGEADEARQRDTRRDGEKRQRHDRADHRTSIEHDDGHHDDAGHEQRGARPHHRDLAPVRRATVNAVASAS